MIETALKQVAITNRYLLFTFLKVGSISFGGNMALLSMVENMMVERDRTLSKTLYFDAIGIASVLPGPLAVNVVTFIGYTLNKRIGALVSLVAILLPAVLLMLLLSWLYFSYATAYASSEVIHYITGAVCAIILATSFTMYKKEIGRSVLKNIVVVIAFAALLAKANFLITLVLIAAGAFLGITCKMGTEKEEQQGDAKSNTLSPSSKKLYLALILLLVVIEALFFFDVQNLIENIYAKIVIVFSGVSLSLFGGGFVAVPVMQSLFVNDLHWVTSAEFVDAIAFSQITPGPILVSATFIGYKLAGITGALLATVAMFGPSAVLIIIVSRAHQLFKDNIMVRRGLNGVKVVIVGMIAASAFKIITYSNYNLKTIALCVVMFIMVQAFRVSPFITVLFSGLLGFLVEKVI